MECADGERTVPEGADCLLATVEEAVGFDPSVAIVAGPASARLNVAMTLAAHGVHLLLEKPIAAELAGTTALLDLCRARNLTLMIGYNLRFSPSLREAKRLVDEGTVGRVLGVRAEVGQYLPDWRPGTDYRRSVSARRSLGGGVLLELSHEIDYICWFFGLPNFVSARGGRYSDLDVDVEDMVELVLEYDSPKRLVSMHLDFLQHAPVRGCRFIGERGTILWDGVAERAHYFLTGDSAWRTSDERVAHDRNRTYVDELEHFLHCVDRGDRPIVNGEDACNVLAVIDAARFSIETGRPFSPRRHA
jgi:predicted dehydrogenase